MLVLNSVSKKTESVLNICARLGNSALKMATILLETGRININSVSGQNEWSALHIASENGSKEIVELLLKHKADVNCKDFYVS